MIDWQRRRFFGEDVKWKISMLHMPNSSAAPDGRDSDKFRPGGYGIFFGFWGRIGELGEFPYQR